MKPSVPSQFINLENKIVEHYHQQNLSSYDKFLDEFYKLPRTQEFKHYFNPLHLYCRFVGQYMFEKEFVKDFLHYDYGIIYNVFCGNGNKTK